MPAGKEFSRRYQVICGKDAEGKVVTWKDLGLKYSKGWLYAVQIADANGWQWTVSALEQGAYRSALEQTGLTVAEIVEIQSDTFEERQFDPPGRFSFVTRRWRGWAYDGEANCWRAPDEALTPFPGVPKAVEAIHAAFTLPEHGWLPITLAAGEQSVSFEASNNYEPFFDLMRWLERLADGLFPRLEMNIEDIYVAFHVFPTNGSLVRFVVTVDDSEVSGNSQTIDMDVLVERRSLIASLYLSFIAFWESEALRRNWEHWDYNARDQDAEPPEEQSWPYKLRSERLDVLCRAGL